jgi:hypothetical protein
MVPASTAHPYEIAFFVVALIDMALSLWLFTMKIADIVRLYRARLNGPMMFMAQDKILHQGIILGLSSGMLMLAVSSLNNLAEPTGQALNLLSGAVWGGVGIVFYELLTFRRRAKLPDLVARYGGIPGGKRATDPPA